jgi:hypothetical protein
MDRERLETSLGLILKNSLQKQLHLQLQQQQQHKLSSPRAATPQKGSKRNSPENRNESNDAGSIYLDPKNIDTAATTDSQIKKEKDLDSQRFEILLNFIFYIFYF